MPNAPDALLEARPPPVTDDRPQDDGDGATLGGLCPVRTVLDRLGDAWSVLVVLNLGCGAMRFNALKRAIPGISQRMLTVTLRSLERDGLVLRTVIPATPPRVEYALTPLGDSFTGPIGILNDWAIAHRHAIAAARAAYDARPPA